LQKCERVGIPAIGSLVYKIDGRSAVLCYNNLQCRLQLLQDGKLKFEFDFPLMMWDEVRELGGYWIVKASTPLDKHAA
jgi:hypothetical protein